MDGVKLLGRITRVCTAAILTMNLLSPAVPSSPDGASGQKTARVPGLLREIRDEVLGLPRYPGEDFARGEFHLGEGDDDTNKTHAVGIVVKDDAGDARMTIVVSRLEPSDGDPRIRYARDARTIVCRIAGANVEVIRSDYPPEDLKKLLADVLKAVIDKKNLLRKLAVAGEDIGEEWEDEAGDSVTPGPVTRLSSRESRAERPWPWASRSRRGP